MPKLPSTISSEADWRAFCDWMVRVCGLGFHPNSDIAEYVSDDGHRTFPSRRRSIALQRLLDEARENIPEERLYDIAFAAMQERFPKLKSDCK